MTIKRINPYLRKASYIKLSYKDTHFYTLPKAETKADPKCKIFADVIESSLIFIKSVNLLLLGRMNKEFCFQWFVKKIKLVNLVKKKADNRIFTSYVTFVKKLAIGNNVGQKRFWIRRLSTYIHQSISYIFLEHRTYRHCIKAGLLSVIESVK